MRWNSKLSYTISCYSLVERLIVHFTAKNWWDSSKQSKKGPELINIKGIVFHQDKARPLTSLMTRQKLGELGCEVLIHPPYSPDLAPSDYHLFRSMHNSLILKLGWRETHNNFWSQFFAAKTQKFNSDGIMSLAGKWKRWSTKLVHLWFNKVHYNINIYIHTYIFGTAPVYRLRSSYCFFSKL